MYIGKLAQLCGVSTKTIRHYEQIGLLPPASRRGSYRVYHERDIERLSLIKQAQQLGFSLAEIKQAISHSGHAPEQGIDWQVITRLLSNKLQSLEQQIAQLQQQRLQVQQQQAVIEACLSADPACQRPLF
ncbi:MerR family transcriptional regulator [Arsukibacterium sp.]|uniref:MerR family transcriptional regulator n=1 Tax=Arsukibacterium sp. TaxID=1977258 RepID=UPI002FD8DAA6